MGGAMGVLFLYVLSINFCTCGCCGCVSARAGWCTSSRAMCRPSNRRDAHP